MLESRGIKIRRNLKLIYVLIAASGVYIFSQWDALTNPYVIGDDVRQQIFWMQKWSDPELFTDDLLTEYAMNYVPWGVKAIYVATHSFINPLQFSSILSGILFVLTAGFLFGLGLRLGDQLTSVLTVCLYCFLGHFMENITSGVSRSFAYPLLAAYLFFLSAKNLIGTGAVILLASVLNPYIFLLCLVTQALFLIHHYWPAIASWLPGYVRFKYFSRPRLSKSEPFIERIHSDADFLQPDRFDNGPLRHSSIVISILLAGSGGFFFLLRYFFFSTNTFGTLVTPGDMIGHAEYSAVGRYEIFPQPSFLTEIIHPWIFNLPFIQWGPLPAWFFALVGLAIIGYAVCSRRKLVMDLSILRVLGYLLVSSLLLYVAARIFIFRLFVPSRYIEFSFNIFFCLVIAKCLRVAMVGWVSDRTIFPLLTTLLIILASLQVYHVGVFDYSNDAKLYRFFDTTPKNVLIAGHPEVMDNVLTFARRKAFVTYELSHTWYASYWNVIKKRTFDFFRAYYSGDPRDIYSFCRKNGIDYLVVRDSDFSEEKLKKGGLYFEPFDSFIRDLAKSQINFALLDRKTFPPIYEAGGIRVIKTDYERDADGAGRL